MDMGYERGVGTRERHGGRLRTGFFAVITAFVLLLTGFVAGAGTVWMLGPNVQNVLPGIMPEAMPTEQEIVTRQEGLDLLQDVWDILEREYVYPDALNDEDMIYGAASGMVSSLGDPHTVFVEPLPASIIQEDMQGSFEGIGATVEMIEGRMTIVRPLPDSPTIRAGLQPGDVILEADGQPLEGMDLFEAITLIRGPRDTTVRLLIEREGVDEPFIVEVTRQRVELPILEAEILDGNIAYLRLTEFNAVSERRMHEALGELLAQNPVGLVLDLRGNPGGYLQMAVDIAGEFLDRGTLILTERERDKPVKEYLVHRDGLATDIPLVVLVDGGSASASEIVAGAIQDNKRGILIGERTFGKGSVQNSHSLRDGSSLRVTIARWYLPGGETLDGEGIAPDIEVVRTVDHLAAGEDPQLDRAIAYLLNGE
ncbi:MAG TPA: S41 family peptidase [Chloroflexi bacterium]|jgi:carboxyl-terminal processing protease|nr:S41 family peptidase [Chloroflexota bacterium]